MSKRKLKSRRAVVDGKKLAATALFVSTEETRYYLNGVFVTQHEAEGVLLVATDGHRMAIIHDRAGVTNGDWICPVPKKIAINAAKNDGVVAFKGDEIVSVAERPKRDLKRWLSQVMPDAFGVYETAPAVDGTYPDWRKVLPKRGKGAEPTATPSFNIALLADFAKLGQILGAKKTDTTEVFMAAKDNYSPTFVRMPRHPDFFGLIMPMRATKITCWPDWIYVPTKAQPVKAAAE